MDTVSPIVATEGEARDGHSVVIGSDTRRATTVARLLLDSLAVQARRVSFAGPALDKNVPMGWAYLAVSVNGAVYTLNAFRPTNKVRALFAWSFFASWITIELAPFHLIWQIVATGFFVRKGALKTTQGKVGLAITVASWVGLVLSIRESWAARAEIKDALRDLTPGERAEVPLPVRTERGIKFARANGKNLKLNIHSPDVAIDPSVRRPALVQIHGGGWVLGFKRYQGRLLMRRLAKRGWVCFNIDYRLSPAATWPDHLVDVKRAIAWIRDHAEEYGVDPGFVAVTGGSAGGHLTALAALTQNDPQYQPGFEDADTSVVAAVPFYGVYDMTNRKGASVAQMESVLLAPWVFKADMADAPEAYAAASPIDQVRKDAPPFLVVHGRADIVAPVQDARDFVEELREVSDQPVYYLELKGAQHAFDTFPSLRSNPVVESAARFLEAVYEAYVEGPGWVAEPEEVVEAVGAELGEELAEELIESEGESVKLD
jgi:acetyl esterase/lipase